MGHIVLKSVFTDQAALIREMVGFYSDGIIDLDPTYGRGSFYRGTGIEPVFKGDIHPSSPGVRKADCRLLARELGETKNFTLRSIMFDPPFLPGASSKKTGAIPTRYGWFRTVRDLWEFYRTSMEAFYDLLKSEGILYFKCQDTVNSGKQWWSHLAIANLAQEIGFELLDLFVLIAKSRLHDPRWKNQRHARKYHCYFWVMRKPRRALWKAR